MTVRPGLIPGVVVEVLLGPSWTNEAREKWPMAWENAIFQARDALAAFLDALLADDEAMTRGGLAAFGESEAPAVARAVLLAAVQEAER